jgi:hypothetical protein
MQTQVSNKLRAYSVVAGSLSLSGSLSAQIIYTDVNPDVVLTYTGNSGTSSFDVDFDNNGTIDVSLRHYGYGQTMAYMYYGNPAIDLRTSLSLVPSYNFPFTLAINYGDSIKPNDTDWVGQNTYTSQFISQSFYPGPVLYSYWAGAGDKYLGIKFPNSAGQYHYGWIRMSLDPSADSLVIKDFAYDSVPNQGLTAGQIITGLDPIRETVSPYIHVFNRILYLNLRSNSSYIKQYVIRLYATNGQLIKEIKSNEPTLRVSLDNLTAGIYLAQVELNGELISHKIYIE